MNRDHSDGEFAASAREKRADVWLLKQFRGSPLPMGIFLDLGALADAADFEGYVNAPSVIADEPPDATEDEIRSRVGLLVERGHVTRLADGQVRLNSFGGAA